MPGWYGRSVDELDAAVNNGEISDAEYLAEMRELLWEREDELAAEDEMAADDAARDNVLGGGW